MKPVTFLSELFGEKILCLGTGVMCGGLCLAESQGAEGEEESLGFGISDSGFAGPGSTSSQLKEDEAPKNPAVHLPFADRFFEPWFDFKKGIKEKYGLDFGIAYTSLFQGSSHALPGNSDTASSGILRLSAQWELYNRGSKNAGKLVMSGDHRHRYGSQPPADLGFSSGYLGIPGTLFNDAEYLLGDLYWAQSFNEGQSGFIVGRFDPNDFLDVSGYANPWSTFQNLSILFNASIALPDWGTGIGGGHWINDSWYLKGAVSDVNSTAEDIKFFDDFGELYSTVEVGWSPSKEERYLKNVHLTAWHADKRENEGVGQSEGLALGPTGHGTKPL